ncbi:MAG: integrase core domain-containing protein [Candidatus Berkelbacteria bacterium]
MYHTPIYLIPKPIARVNKYNLWRSIAKKKLSEKAQLRLEWIIFYYTAGNENASLTAKHYGIARSKFYHWFSRFNDRRLELLEDKSSKPRNTRCWQPDPIVLVRMIKLRKEFIHWSKVKLSVVYKNRYGDNISSWQFQRVIERFNLYPPRKKRIYAKNKGKRQLISYDIRQKAEDLYSIDTKVLWLFGLKYYIITAVGHTGKLAYARAYRSHTSATAADFLERLEYLVGKDNLAIILSDNGSEFQKDFNETCGRKNIQRYYSRVRTPKDNPEVERLNKTLIEEWLNDGKCSENLDRFNKYITEWLIVYNNVRPHQTLQYLTPLQYAEKHGLLSKRSSLSTNHCYFEMFVV